MTSAVMYEGRFPAWKGNSRGLVEANGEAGRNSMNLLGSCRRIRNELLIVEQLSGIGRSGTSDAGGYFWLGKNSVAV